MSTQIKVPTLGESVTEATVAKWIKKPGESVLLDEPVVELETDKVTLEVGSPAAGILKSIEVQQGANVGVGAVLGLVEAGAVKSESAAVKAPESPAKGAAMTAAPHVASSELPLAPSVKKLVAENALTPQNIPASGKDGRLTKGDVLTHMSKGSISTGSASGSTRQEERVPMSRLRKKIAERLKSAQDTAAILTTFNEVDMSTVMDVRNRLKDRFEKRHQVKLGFMSFFVKACTTALKELPAVNARIDGDDIIYHNYCDIGVAVGTEQGLVVPIVRNADQMSFAQIESAIAGYGKKAKEGKLSIDDMTGGTFTISNGGVYGSLMSTPILNPPQSGILGMHKIQERPMVHNGQIVIRPMMYLALSYDHRIIDGKEAVTFLVRVKECLEDPERMLLEA
jgi:2-oxoglutarate dehydrogenase E2 component (dihydrolipoamide succinyltransferase)